MITCSRFPSVRQVDSPHRPLVQIGGVSCLRLKTARRLFTPAQPVLHRAVAARLSLNCKPCTSRVHLHPKSPHMPALIEAIHIKHKMALRALAHPASHNAPGAHSLSSR